MNFDEQQYLLMAKSIISFKGDFVVVCVICVFSVSNKNFM